MVLIRNLRIVALALMASGVIYVAALFMALQDASGDGGDLWLPMAAAAAGAAVGSFVVPRALPRTGQGETALKRAASGFFTRTILALAMSEAVIIFGFAASFVAQEPLGIVPFFVAGELLMLIHFPRIARFEAELDGQAQIEWAQQQR